MTGPINVKLETQRITVTYSSVLVPMEVTFRYTDSSDTPHTLTSVVHLVGMFDCVYYCLFSIMLLFDISYEKLYYQDIFNVTVNLPTKFYRSTRSVMNKVCA